MSIDFTTEYLGLTLKSPLIASASPCTGQPDVLRQLESHGAGAAVLPSLFEEQILCEGQPPEATTELAEFPCLKQYNSGADSYASLVEHARSAVSMPIIGSLNGVTPSHLVEQVRRIASAGADAIELNLHYVPVDPSASSMSVEARYLDVVAAVSEQAQLPVAVKIGPYFSSLPYFARQVVDAGANGLVLFNRFLEPEINLENHSIDPHLELSQPCETRLSLRWLGILRDQLSCCSLAACGGYHTPLDALKALAVGADTVMVTSVLLKQGAAHLQQLYDDMVEWLTVHEYQSVRQIIGTMSRDKYHAPNVFERANYAETLASYMEHGAAAN